MHLVFFSSANSLHLKEWSEYLRHECGHRVTVVTLPEPTLPYDDIELVHIGNTLSWVPPAGVQKHPITKMGWMTTIPRLRRELKRLKPDVLIAYRIVSYGFLAALSGWRPLVLAGQSGNLTHPSNSWLARKCVRFAVSRADLLHAWSPNMRDELLRYGADPRRVITCARGVDLRHFPFLPRIHGPLRIVATRSLQRSYNLRQLVEAMPFVLEAEPQARCDIAGDGLQRPALEALADRSGVAHCVRFLGRVPHPAVASLLQQANIYVSTTTTDGLPLSNIEAMASGVYPVVSQIEANGIWIEEGKNGSLFPLGDPRALAACILDAYRNPAKRARAAAANRRLVETTFDRATNLPAMVQRYQQLIAS